MLDVLFRNGKIVAREDSQVGQLARSESSLFSVFRRKPTAPERVELQSFLSIEAVLGWVKAQAPDGLTCDKPVKREERIVTGDSCGVRSGSHGDPHLEHAPDGWRSLSLLRAIALDKIFALKSHAVLHGNAPTERFHTFDVAIADRFAVIKKPMQAVKRDLAIDLFVHGQGSLDCLVVGGMQTKRPAILHEMPDHRFQFTLHDREHVGPWLEEVLEIGGCENEVLTRAVHAVKVGARAGFRHLCPILEIGQFLFGFLRKEVVGKTNRKLPASVQFVYDSVVVGIVLEATAGVNHAGKAKAVEFPEKETRGVDLVLARQLRSPSQCGIKNIRVGFCDKQTGGISARIPPHFSGEKFRRVLAVARGTPGRSV